jgi:hypothetical protein
MYLAASARTVQASWDKFRTCSVVLDEARFANADVLQVFLACPMDAGSSAGTLLPPQVLPQLHLDLQAVDVELRITEANRRGASARAPKGDPLVATWEICVGLHRALGSVLPHGFMEFLPQQAPERICASRLGTYALERGGVEVALPATPAKLDHFGCGGRLGVWPAEEAGDFAPLIEPGHSVSKVPNALRWGGTPKISIAGLARHGPARPAGNPWNSTIIRRVMFSPPTLSASQEFAWGSEREAKFQGVVPNSRNGCPPPIVGRSNFRSGPRLFRLSGHVSVMRRKIDSSMSIISCCRLSGHRPHKR